MQKIGMTSAFYITFWAVILILLIITVIYTLFAYQNIGEFEGLNDDSRLIQARDYLLWSLILFSIALALVVIFMIGAFAIGWESIYQKSGFVFILHIFFFLWVLAAVLLLVIASERIDGNSKTLSSTKLQQSIRDIGIGLIGGSTVLVLLAGAYLGHAYRTEKKRYYCKQMYTLNKLKTSV